jgi:hypothetical protein
LYESYFSLAIRRVVIYYRDMENNKLTAEQLEALKTFAAVNGRYWKAVLRDCWMAGGYNSETGSYIGGPLQQVRNELGPSWLTRFSLKGVA